MLCSVVIRTYNRADLVVETLRSALAQDLADKEIIVVDDGSTDNTREALEPFIQRGEIIYHWQENAGLQGARLAGFALCQGEYYIFYDAGDHWDSPGYLRHAIGLLQKHNAAIGMLNFRRHMAATGQIQGGYPEEAGPLRPILRDMDLAALESPLEASREAEFVRVLSNEQMRELFIDCMPAPSTGLMMRRDSTRGAWRGDDRRDCRSDDWMQVLFAVLEHNATGVLDMRRLWTKPITPDSTADGEMPLVKFLEYRIGDRQIMLDNFGVFFTPEEREIFRRKLLSYELDCAREHLRARPRNFSKALAHFREALGHDFKRALRQAPSLLRG